MWHDLLITPTDLPKEEFEGYGYSVDVLLRIKLDDEYKSIVHAVGYCQLIEEIEGEAVWWSCTERGDTSSISRTKFSHGSTLNKHCTLLH